MSQASSAIVQKLHGFGKQSRILSERKLQHYKTCDIYIYIYILYIYIYVYIRCGLYKGAVVLTMQQPLRTAPTS